MANKQNNQPETSEVKPRGFSSKKNIIIIALAAVLALGGGVAAVSLGAASRAERSTASGIQLAERYLSELNYERAVIEFQRVLEIEPRNVDAYLGLAKAYIGLGDTEKALEVLQQGLEITGDQRIQAMIDELTKPAEPPVSSSITTSSTRSDPAVSKPVFGSMGSAVIAGTEIDIATTTSLLIYNKELYEKGYMVQWNGGGGIGNWHISAIDDAENKFGAVVELSNELTAADLEELQKLTQLRSLTACYSGLNDLTPLTKLQSLWNIVLRSNDIVDISPLSQIQSLTSLDLGYNLITDVTPLASLTKLTYLNLECNNITDISPLGKLINLNSLRITANYITEISSVSQLKKLTYLSASMNLISDITPLAELTNLKNLSIGNNSINDSDKAQLQAQLPDCKIS